MVITAELVMVIKMNHKKIKSLNIRPERVRELINQIEDQQIDIQSIRDEVEEINN